MRKMKVEIEFKDSLKDLIIGFLTCSNKLDCLDEYVNGDELTEKGKRLIKNNLVDTENPHHQIRKQIQLKLVIKYVPRAVIYEFDRHPIGKQSIDFFSENNVPTISSTRYALHHIAKDPRIPEIIEKELSTSMLMYEDLVSDYYFIPEDDFSEIEERESWLFSRMEDLSNIKFYKNMYSQSNDKLKKYINEFMYADSIYCKCTGEWLYNFLRQRLDGSAYYLIQDLAKLMYEAIPEDFKDIFKVYKYQKVKPFSIDRSTVKVDKGRILIDMSIPEWTSLQEILSKNLVEKKYLI